MLNGSLNRYPSISGSTTVEHRRSILALGEKYLNFVLLDEEYCIEITEVREIMALPEITPLPQTPDFIQGVINLRGHIIPIIDLKKRFQLSGGAYGERACVIVVEAAFGEAEMLMGLVVDETKEVLTIPAERISELAYITARIKSQYIDGVADFGDHVKIILNIRKMFSEEEFTLLGSVEHEGDTP